jgi:hypothetical protein
MCCYHVFILIPANKRKQNMTFVSVLKTFARFVRPSTSPSRRHETKNMEPMIFLGIDGGVSWLVSRCLPKAPPPMAITTAPRIIDVTPVVEVKPEPERQSERVANEVPLAGGIGQRKLVIWGSYQALLVHTISLFFQPDRKRVYYFIFSRRVAVRYHWRLCRSLARAHRFPPI